MDKLPKEFIHQIEALSNPELDGLCDALVTTEPSVSVRVNPVKGVHVPDGADIVPWCATGYYLKSRNRSRSIRRCIRVFTMHRMRLR